MSFVEVPARTQDEPRYLVVDFPAWKVDSLDREAKTLGVTRQSVIKVWLAQKLEKTNH